MGLRLLRDKMNITKKDIRDSDANYRCRSYNIKFKSKRNFNPEKGVKVNSYSLNWNFTDTKLGSPIDVELTEKVSDGNADVIAKVRFKKSDSDVSRIDDYVRIQMEMIAKDGMVKL